MAAVLTLATQGAPAHDAPDFRATAHSIAVVSILGDEINAFGPPHAVDGAGFDALSETAMTTQIGADLPDAKVATVDLPRAELHGWMYPHTGFGDPGMDRTRESLKAWAAAHRADYIVIFRKTVGMPPGTYYKTTFFGIGLFNTVPVAFLNITVLDGRTLDVVAQLSTRDVGWGSIQYGRNDPTPDKLPVLADDTKAMLASVVPALTHGVGL